MCCAQGRWVPRNIKGRNGWHLPVTLPPEGYGGPYAMKELLVDIGGCVWGRRQNRSDTKPCGELEEE